MAANGTSAYPLRVALLGAGKWMRSHHLPVVQRLQHQGIISVNGIWNRTRATAVELATSYGFPRVYETIDELSGDSSLDGAIVCVSRNAIFEVAGHFAEKQLPLLVEKPPGNTSAEAHQLTQMIGDRAVVGFNRRFAPIVERFRDVALQPSPVHYIDCQFTRKARADPRFVSESGIHGINLLEWLFGPVDNVTPRAHVSDGTRTEGPRALSWEALLTFNSGASAHVAFFPHTGFSGERYTAYGKDRTIVLDYGCHYCDDKTSRIRVYESHREGAVLDEIDGTEDPFVREGFIREYYDFLELMRSGQVSRSTFATSWTSLRVCEEIERAFVSTTS